MKRAIATILIFLMMPAGAFAFDKSAGVVGPQRTDCSLFTANGRLCMDLDDGTLYMGWNGAANAMGGSLATIETLTLGADGVIFTNDSDGAFTMTGAGNGADEALTVNLDDTANTVVLSSSTAADNIVGLASYSLGSAGVKLTGDGDGAITLLGLGDGTDEDLTINLDDTADTATVSSSTGVATINFSAIALATSGAITGKVPTPVADTDAAVAITNVKGHVYVNGDNDVIDYSLPDGTAGDLVCFHANGYAQVITVDSHGNDTIYLDGTALDAGDAIDSAGGAGDLICLLWHTDAIIHNWGTRGTWVDGGAD